MGKLLDMAFRAAEGNRTETSRLTMEEKEIYDEVHSLLKEKRSLLLGGVRNKVAESEEPSLDTAAVPDMVTEARREDREEAAADVPPYPQDEAADEAEATAPSKVETERGPEEAGVQEVTNPAPVAAPAARLAADFVILRILEDIPKFVGPDRTYKLRKEDLVSMPSTISKALIVRKKAVAVSIVHPA
jgi:DNA replication factor GINS